MPTRRLPAIAALALVVLLAAPVHAGPTGPTGPSPCAPANEPPEAPFPLQAHRIDPAAVALEWLDYANRHAGIEVDSYIIYRAPLLPSRGGVVGPMQPIAMVDGNTFQYVDPTSSGGEFLYWVAGHNCAGTGQQSNAAASSLPYCAGWVLDPQGGIQGAWVSPSCIAGAPCFITITVGGSIIEHQGCGLSS